MNDTEIINAVEEILMRQKTYEEFGYSGGKFYTPNGLIEADSLRELFTKWAAMMNGTKEGIKP